MKPLLVLILAVGLASADIGLTYKVPDTSYGVPAYQYNDNTEYNSGYANANGYNYKAESSAQAEYASALGANSNSAGYQTGNYAGTGSQYYQNGGLNSGYNTVSQPAYQSSSQGGYQYQTSNEYQSSAVQKYHEFYNQWQQQPAQVFKHFYVHAAPEEPEEPKRRQPIALPPPQKHYKIIFVKAPTQTVYTPQYIPVPQPNEEKTIVYVLVKKPEEQQEVVVPKLEQKPPTKPEVFFIKYNNKADSSAVINNIVSDYNKVDTVHFANGAANVGDYNAGSGLYQTTGQYSHSTSGLGNSGQYTQGTTNQFAHNGAGQTSTFSGLSSQTATTAGSSATTANAGYTASSTAGYSTGISDTSGVNAISTSQHVPHETYGPPNFRA